MHPHTAGPGVTAQITRVVNYRREDDSWMARSPMLPRWTAVAETFEECERLAKEAFDFFGDGKG